MLVYSFEIISYNYKVSPFIFSFGKSMRITIAHREYINYLNRY